ncbi:uncharacterized protein LOC112184611 [Rhizophagus clarus]|uniref:ATP-dependent DNA helicase n=1 Tax=Rhizophagus clarus TaxID=94130 RepID=A0A8H3LVY7_9GLOM|nr:uncharacterized protein LOC112184611 [Rhizophagus clarus]
MILASENKPKTPEDFDKLVCAEIPDRNLQPLLFETVNKNMVHGSCGVLNSQSPCMINGKCSKNYHHEFVLTTSINKYGYPLYRRRNNGHTITKGYDRVIVSIKNSNDEIEKYLNARYDSASEACWRLFNFGLQERSHKVERLPVYLPNQQSVIFQKNENVHIILEKSSHTKLTYRNWQQRKRNNGKVISRMYMCSPRDKERFYLKTLLTQVSGTTSYESVHTINGITYDTYEEAIQQLGSVFDEKNNEFGKCLKEAASYQMPSKLRQLFATILLFCDPKEFNACKLLEDYLDNLNEDYLFQQQQQLNESDLSDNDHAVITTKTLADIEKISYILCNLFNMILAKVRLNHKIALAVASSGIAALLLDGGRTAHSRFKIPIPLTEIPMTHKFAFEAVDRTFRDITGIEEPFGGKFFIMGGDFKQILPVVIQGTRGQIIECMYKIFKFMEIFDEGKNNIEEDIIKLSNDIILNNNHIESLISKVFDNFNINYNNANNYTNFIKDRAILTTKNEVVNDINEKIIKNFPGQAQEFLSADLVEDEDSVHQNLYPIEFLNTLTPSRTPPHKLILKVSAPIMILRNINPIEGLCNGTTRLIVRRFQQHVIDAEILTGSHIGKRVFIPRIKITPSDVRLPFQLVRR